MLFSIRNLILVTLLLVKAAPALAEPPSPKLREMLPNEIGDFHQLLTMRPLVTLSKEGVLEPAVFRVAPNQSESPFIGAEVDYLSSAGERLRVEIVKLQGEPDAYSFFTLVARKMRESFPDEQIIPGGVGTASISTAQGAMFFRGATFLRITNTNASSGGSKVALALARLFADRLDKGEGDIPVLVAHLPDWQKAQARAVYFVSLPALQQTVSNQLILSELNFEGGTEAVAAYYGSSYLVIVEFTTPQLAGDNDRRITPKIQELRNAGQAVPSAYRRVGNYSVFVFNAPDEKTATQLIDQVKYEQVVQWLGDDPYWWEKAQRIYMRTTGGVVIAVLQSSGLSFLICLTIGGIIGTVLFKRRRTRQAAAGYSDAGGMVRLNIDELTEETNRRKLLGRGEP